MKAFLNNIRNKEKELSLLRQLINTLGVLLLGVALGVFSKFLDNTPINELPHIFEQLDIGNFLGEFAIWMLIALCISIYSNSAVRASINVFVFFAGMVTSYYFYSNFVAGFFPRSYAMIWVGYTVVSPILAFFCWYAKGESKVSYALSAFIIAVMFSVTFSYGWFYIFIGSVLDLLVFLCTILVLKRRTLKGSAVMTAVGLTVALVLKPLFELVFFY